MTVFSDPIDLSSTRRPLGALAADAVRGLARVLAAGMPRPRPAPPHLSDHILRDLGLTRAEYERL